MAKQGELVNCEFTKEMPATNEVLAKGTDSITVKMRVRKFFDHDSSTIAMDVLEPGELTQGLCSPWQNDYRECACYYWAASRPDYVNVVDTASGDTSGDNWMNKPKTSGDPYYVLDDRADPRLLSYDDLFRDWQGLLRFVIGGSNTQDNADRDGDKADRNNSGA